MSVNNQLEILKEKGKFNVHENICVGNKFIPNEDTLLESCSTLDKAIKYANEYCKKWPCVEYGYHIDDSCLDEGLK